MFYSCAFTPAETELVLPLGSVTMDKGSGSTITVVLSTLTDTARDGTSNAGTFWIYTMSDGIEVDDQGPYADLRFDHYCRRTYAERLEAALRTAATAAAWVPVPFVTMTNTGKYQMGVDTGTVEITFSTAGTKKLLGFSATKSGSSQYTSDWQPWYTIYPTLQAVSDPTLNYEPSGVGTRVASDTGAGAGVARYVSPLYRDWVQQFESKEITMRLQAATAAPFTYQHMFEHCRGVYPFLCYDGGFHTTETYPEVFTFREEGIPFTPQRATPGNDAQLHIPFRTIVEGTVAPYSIPV